MQNKQSHMATKTVAFCALLSAISIVLALIFAVTFLCRKVRG